MIRSFLLLICLGLCVGCAVEPIAQAPIVQAPTNTPYVIVVTGTPAPAGEEVVNDSPTPTPPALPTAVPSVSLARLSITEGEILTINGIGWPPNTDLIVSSGRAGTDGAEPIANIRSDEKGLFVADVSVVPPAEGFGTTTERMGLVVATEDRQFVAFAEVELAPALIVVPAPTSEVVQALPATPLPVQAPQDTPAFLNYIRTTYSTIGDHTLQVQHFNIIGADEDDPDMPVLVAISIDLDEFKIVDKLPEADLRAWAEALRNDLAAHWPERDVSATLAWTYYLDSYREESDCHHIGDYSVENDGWYHVQYVVRAVAYRSIGHEGVEVCGGK